MSREVIHINIAVTSGVQKRLSRMGTQGNGLGARGGGEAQYSLTSDNEAYSEAASSST